MKKGFDCRGQNDQREVYPTTLQLMTEWMGTFLNPELCWLKPWNCSVYCFKKCIFVKSPCPDKVIQCRLCMEYLIQPFSNNNQVGNPLYDRLHETLSQSRMDPHFHVVDSTFLLHHLCVTAYNLNRNRKYLNLNAYFLLTSC